MWAQRLLGLTLTPRDQQTIPGDLLEEYRERVGQGRPVRSANRWYARQVASLLWMAALPGLLLLAGAVFTNGAVFRTSIWAVSRSWDVGPRSGLLLTATAASYFLAGACGGWLTRRVRFATVMVATATIVALLANPAAALLHATLWTVAPTPSQLRISGGHVALLMFPGLLLGLLIGIAGAGFARLFPGRNGWSRSRAV
jgi:hypothetical protein